MSTAGLVGFAGLRTRPGRPSALTHEVRHCSECGTRIARLHEGTLCYRCEDAQIAAEVDREIELRTPVRTRRPWQEYDLGPDTPTMAVPTIGLLADWHGLIDAFLDGPEDVVRLTGFSVSQMTRCIHTALRRRALTGSLMCVQRKGQVYLMRKEGEGSKGESSKQPWEGRS